MQALICYSLIHYFNELVLNQGNLSPDEVGSLETNHKQKQSMKPLPFSSLTLVVLHCSSLKYFSLSSFSMPSSFYSLLPTFRIQTHFITLKKSEENGNTWFFAYKFMISFCLAASTVLIIGNYLKTFYDIGNKDNLQFPTISSEDLNQIGKILNVGHQGKLNYAS
mgnify:CR=1 FL=1